MPFATLKEAEAVAGKLSRPSKMPGYAYSIPAVRCPIGSILVNTPGSVCSNCYALKGRYVFPNVRAAMEKRFESLTDPLWVEAIVFMVTFRGCEHFRWHDSGDLQNDAHLERIAEVARRCPDTQFWLPTRETATVRRYLAKHGAFPPNLTVRVSAAMINGRVVGSFPNTSTVVTDGSHTCPAYKQGGVCGDCRACWDPAVRNVSYPKH